MNFSIDMNDMKTNASSRCNDRGDESRAHAVVSFDAFFYMRGLAQPARNQTRMRWSFLRLSAKASFCFLLGQDDDELCFFFFSSSSAAIAADTASAQRVRRESLDFNQPRRRGSPMAHR